MAEMTTAPLRDNFTRADQGPPPSGSWTSIIGVSIPDVDGWDVISNQAAQNGADAALCSTYWNAQVFGPNTEAWATLAVVPATAARAFDLWLKISSPGTGVTGYACRVSNPSLPTIDLSLGRYDNGVRTQIGVNRSEIMANGDNVIIRAVDGNIRAVVSNGLGRIIQSTDLTYPGAGYAGIRGSASDTRLSAFGAGTIPPQVLLPMGVGSALMT